MLLECVVLCVVFQEKLSELLWMSWEVLIKLLFRGLNDTSYSLAKLKWWAKVRVDIWCFLQQALFEQDFLDSGCYQRQMNISMCLWVYFHYACEVAQSCPTLCEPTRLLRPWHFPGKCTGVGCYFLFQGIFPMQGSSPGLPHCGQRLYHLSHQGIATKVEKYNLTKRNQEEI